MINLVNIYIHLLNLVEFLQFMHSDFFPHLDGLLFVVGLGKHVGMLVFGVRVSNFDHPLLNALPHVAEPGVYVFAPLVMNLVLAK